MADTLWYLINHIATVCICFLATCLSPLDVGGGGRSRTGGKLRSPF